MARAVHSKEGMATNHPTKFIVMVRKARMPNSCWGRYVRVGVVEFDPSLLPPRRTKPAMLSGRARGVVRVVRTWERLYDGGPRSASAKAVAEAEALVASLEADRSAT